jgi:ribonucleoside-triphosphate reductase
MVNEMKVVKRDGTTQQFDTSKITNAISKAGKETGEYGEDIATNLTAKVVRGLASFYEHANPPSVEEIQDLVEGVLLKSSYKKTAKAYILYRDRHSQARELLRTQNLGLVDNYLKESDWRVRENSNMIFSLQGLHNLMSSEISSYYWLNKLYPESVRNAHQSGDMHIHDLGFLASYCVGWDLYDILLRGFCGVPGKVASAPAKHFRTALGQVVNFIFTLQGEAAGAQALSNFDTLLAPFIRMDNLSEGEVRQALQEFLFNMNVPTRVGCQAPFSNITLDLKPPKIYSDQGVIIGGKPQDLKYGECQKEMDLLNRVLFDLMAKGDAQGRVFSFPIPTVNITDDFPWDKPELRGLWEITAKYGIPYFANFVNSDLNPEDARSMCCRLRLDVKQLKHRGGGLFGSSPLTGSVGVCTINLPRLGYQSRTEEEFFSRLKNLLNVAKTSLEIKRKAIETFTDHGLYPYSRVYLGSIKQRTGKYWTNHFSTIGVVGMSEACLNFAPLGVPLSDEKARAFAIKVLNYIREELTVFQNETGNLYNLEATPAEGTSYRLALLDKKRFPQIRSANEDMLKDGAQPFYTNSTQLPVDTTSDMFRLLEQQDSLQTLYTGGTVQHLFLGERMADPEAVKSLIKRIFAKFHLPYISITPTFSVCPKCGYRIGQHETCPDCGSTCEVYSRVVGYLRPVNQWNAGKQSEFKLRKNLVCA